MLKMPYLFILEHIPKVSRVIINHNHEVSDTTLRGDSIWTHKSKAQLISSHMHYLFISLYSSLFVKHTVFTKIHGYFFIFIQQI